MPSADEILIVGGGPGGLATALFLAQRGIGSTVLERGTWPREKVCGQGVMPTGVVALKELGLELARTGGRELRGVQFRSDTGRVAQAAFPDGHCAWGIERRHLSESLYQLACRSPLIRLRPHARLVSLTSRAIGFSAGIQSGHTTNHESFSCVIGADGMRSTTARLLGVPEKSFRMPPRFGIQQHFQIQPWSSYVEVEWHRGFELYATPVGPDVVAIAALTWPGHLPKGPGRLMELVKRTPLLREKLRHATPLDAAFVYGPLGVRRPQPRHESACLVGDAFCFWDGITGEGIATSLVQARMIAEFIGAHGHANLTALKLHLPRTLRSYLLTTHLALRLSRSPVVRDWVFQLFNGWPALFRGMVHMSRPTVVKL